MKPVLVLQHLPDDGPAFLSTWLAAQGRAVELRHAAAGDVYPARIDDYAALAVLGGEWSANDERPTLRQAETLIRQAVAGGVPVLGHCLGGQLMARALGAAVGPSSAPERGWHRVQIACGPQARRWFGSDPAPVVFQWHRDVFELPAGAESLAGNAACRHQAFGFGPHLAMQFHIEVDAAKLAAWAAEAGQEGLGGDGIAAPPTWHDAARMRLDTVEHLARSQALAGRVYGEWLRFAR